MEARDRRFFVAIYHALRDMTPVERAEVSSWAEHDATCAGGSDCLQCREEPPTWHGTDVGRYPYAALVEWARGEP